MRETKRGVEFKNRISLFLLVNSKAAVPGGCLLVC